MVAREKCVERKKNVRGRLYEKSLKDGVWLVHKTITHILSRRNFYTVLLSMEFILLVSVSVEELASLVILSNKNIMRIPVAIAANVEPSETNNMGDWCRCTR